MGRIRWRTRQTLLVATPLILGLISAGVAEAGKSRKPAVASHIHRPERHVLPLIVVDPGHGGRDSGAIGLSGTREKDITLATARELERQIAATRRYRVALTRRGDTFVSLSQRVAYARKHRAALFVSIHADASKDRSVHGASVYTGLPTANGSKVMELAANPSNAGAIAEALSSGARSSGSARLQYRLIDSLNDEVRMMRDSSRQAELYVLMRLGIPGALLEMGFLSNREDENLLRQPKHRAIIARAIRDAIDDYFQDVKQPGVGRT